MAASDEPRLAELLALAAAWTPPKFPLAGRDVTALGIPPGPRVGQLLAEVRRWWEEGDFTPDRAACLARLKEIADADELVFYTNPMSRGRIVRWMLEEVAVPYRTEILEYGTTMKAPAYLAINPMGKVPAIRHGDTVVTEVAAICAYLGRRVSAGGAGAAARRPAARTLLPLAVLRRRTARSGGDRLKPLGAVVPEERERMVGWGKLDHVVDALEAAVSQNAISGRRQLYRRRPLCRVAYRLRHAVRHRSRSGRRSSGTGSGSAPDRRRGVPRRSTTR